MIQISKVIPKTDGFEEAVHEFWKQWGNEKNYDLYYDCIVHSADTEDSIPSFYVAKKDERIVGTYALIRNDFISRQDLFPWLACLYVSPECRGQQLGKRLLDHACEEAANYGFHHLYLSTDLEGYYEKYDWTHIAKGYGVGGGNIKIYQKATR